jgi:acetoin utilization protein AcuB
MKVKNWIRKHPISIKRTALLQEAVQLMKQHGIRHLPVIDDDGDLVGLVTESDLRQFSFPAMVEEIPVHEVMETNPQTINANASIEEAARLIHDNKISGLPVMDDGHLVAMITASDLLSAFIEVMGLLKATTRIDVLVSEECGGVAMVTKIIKAHECEIVNVATDSKEGRNKLYYFRLEHCEAGPLVKDLESAGHKVLSVME